MTGPRYYHKTEVIPRHPWKSKKPLPSRPMKISRNAGREEHSMDWYRCRPDSSERFGRHWSTWISGEMRMDQSLGALFSGENCMEQWPWKFVKRFPRDWYWSMVGSSRTGFGGLLFVLACAVPFVRWRLWALSTKYQRSRPNCRLTQCTEHASKKIRPSRRPNFTFFRH